MGVLTMHHWPTSRRAARASPGGRRRVVLLTWDPEFDDALWLTTDYLPGVRVRDRAIFPRLPVVLAALQPQRGFTVEPVLVPHDCSDGFLGAWWRRPAAYLDPVVQTGISSFCELGRVTGRRSRASPPTSKAGSGSGATARSSTSRSSTWAIASSLSS